MYMKENMSLQYLFRTVKESGWIQALLVGVWAKLRLPPS